MRYTNARDIGTTGQRYWAGIRSRHLAGMPKVNFQAIMDRNGMALIA